MAEENRPRLGRGLAALIGDSAPEHAARMMAAGQRRIPIEFIRPNPKNPRRSFDDGQLAELADSIREKGVLQPIIVRANPRTADAYEIIAGERRWRAAQKAGIHDVPVVVVVADDKQALEIAIIENVQRSDLNAIEEGLGYEQLASDYSYSHSDLARIIGKSRSHIANTLRLLKLPAPLHEMVRSGQISAGHARALLAVDDPESVAKRILAEGLTVRDVKKQPVKSHSRLNQWRSRMPTRARLKKCSPMFWACWSKLIMPAKRVLSSSAIRRSSNLMRSAIV